MMYSHHCCPFFLGGGALIDPFPFHTDITHLQHRPSPWKRFHLKENPWSSNPHPNPNPSQPHLQHVAVDRTSNHSHSCKSPANDFQVFRIKFFAMFFPSLGPKQRSTQINETLPLIHQYHGRQVVRQQVSHGEAERIGTNAIVLTGAKPV